MTSATKLKAQIRFMTTQELVNLKERVESRIEHLQYAQRTKVQEEAQRRLQKQKDLTLAVIEVYALLKDKGIAMHEFMASVKKYKFPRTLEAPGQPEARTVHRNLKNPDQSWSGRGRPPLWYVEQVKDQLNQVRT